MSAIDLDDRWALRVIAFPVRDIIGNSRRWSAGATGGGSMDWATDTSEVIGPRRLGVDAGNEEDRAGE